MTSPIPEGAVPGVALRDIVTSRHPLEDLASDRSGWARIFEETRKEIREFISCRDALEVLCKSTTYRLVSEKQVEEGNEDGVATRLEQADVETLHALVLMYGKNHSRVPSAPKTFSRIWPIISKSLFAFSRMQAPLTNADDKLNYALARVRVHTMYYRNTFDREDCEKTLRNILARVDPVSEREIGLRLSDAFEMLVCLIGKVEDRLHIFLEHFGTLGKGDDAAAVERSIDFLRGTTPLAARLLLSIDRRKCDFKTRAAAAFQVCDVVHSWIYTFERTELLREFGVPLVQFLDEITIPVGGLSDAKPDHIYMNNPVWAQPFVGFPTGKVMFPEPYLPLSFPFRIFEPFVSKTSTLKKAYEKARAAFLEDRIEEIVRLSLPSADVYRGVEWTEPSTGVVYENDVIAILGNYIFLLEAKSGRLDDAGRRGGSQSFQENLRDLYVKPGEQAFRLQRYLAEYKENADLRLKDGTQVVVHFDHPKIVHKYSVAMEHFASLTSGKRAYVELGLLKAEDAWAPIFSIGELEMLSRHLDTEISFFHYLTRRSTIEELAYFSGDEQDFLSLYLTNAFCMDFNSLSGVRLAFTNLDKTIRVKKAARVRRTEPVALGVQLSPLWKTFLRDIYRSAFPHRFDTIEVLLNQHPADLFDIERKIRKWHGGMPGPKNGETVMCHAALSKRTFLFAVFLSKTGPNQKEWVTLTRRISYREGRERVGATDCATLLVLKRSRSSFDGITFHRFIDPHDPMSQFVGTPPFVAIDPDR